MITVFIMFTFIVGVQIAIIGTAIAESCSKNTPFVRHELKANEFLLDGQCLTSSNGLFASCMESNGTLITYGPNDKIVFNTYTDEINATLIYTSPKKPYRLLMDESGDLVIYDANYAPLWDTVTAGRGPSPVKLVQEDNGDLIIYAKDENAIWISTNKNGIIPKTDLGDTLPNGQAMHQDECLVSKNGLYKVCLWHTGEFVLSQTNLGIMWHTPTFGKGTPLFTVNLLWTNNLEIRDRSGYRDYKVLWDTETAGKGAAATGQLIMKDDGELVVVAEGVTLWSNQKGTLV